MFVDRDAEGVWLQEMPFWVVDTLTRLPEWLESNDPRVRDRLLPKAHADEAEDADWQRHVVPELEHLFASRSEIVRKDLGSLQLDVAEGGTKELEDGMELGIDATFSLFIPDKHVSAWTTSLQAATQAIFILEELTEDQLGEDPRLEVDAEKQVALLRMAALQEIIVQLVED